MRKIREVLRLRDECNLSQREIGACLGIGRSTVKDYLDRARVQDLRWPLPQEWDDAALEARLFPDDPGKRSRKENLDYDYLEKELPKKQVRLSLLWYEYKKANPKGLQYSQFCQRFRKWRAKGDLVMRQTHRAGEKMFVDYAGRSLEVKDGKGATRQAQIFVAVLGASNYTYAEATWSQSLEDWIGSHVRAFAFFGGVAGLVISDNLKSGVNKPHRYESEVNASYQEMARHYQTAVMPTRVGKPKDKGKVEQGVLLVERWIAAVLRHQTFHGLAELNRAIRALLERLNEKPFQKMSGCRRQRFESLEKPVLKPLPSQPYELGYWKIKRVGMDYHVGLEGHITIVCPTLWPTRKWRCATVRPPWRSFTDIDG